jgi:hypothetical protein
MFPDLFAENPASHLIWVVALGIFAVLGVIVLVEVYDWVRGRLLGLWRRGEARAAAPEGDERWMLREPDGELRRRHHRRLEPDRRTWEDGSPNRDAGRR